MVASWSGLLEFFHLYTTENQVVVLSLESTPFQFVHRFIDPLGIREIGDYNRYNSPDRTNGGLFYRSGQRSRQVVSS